MELTLPAISVIIGAVRTRAAVAETGPHTVDFRPGADGHVRWRCDALADSIDVFDSLQFTDNAQQTVVGCRHSDQDSDHQHDTAVHLHQSTDGAAAEYSKRYHHHHHLIR